MSERRITTKAELLADMRQVWTELTTALAQLTPAQMSTNQDTQGWTLKEHLIVKG